MALSAGVAATVAGCATENGATRTAVEAVTLKERSMSSCRYPVCLNKRDLEGLQRGEALRVDAQRPTWSTNSLALHFLQPTQIFDITDAVRSGCSGRECEIRHVLSAARKQDAATNAAVSGATAYSNGAFLVFGTRRVHSDTAACERMLFDTKECRSRAAHVAQYFGFPSCITIETAALVVSREAPILLENDQFAIDGRQLWSSTEMQMNEIERQSVDASRRRFFVLKYHHEVCAKSQVGTLKR